MGQADRVARPRRESHSDPGPIAHASPARGSGPNSSSSYYSADSDDGSGPPVEGEEGPPPVEGRCWDAAGEAHWVQAPMIAVENETPPPFELVEGPGGRAVVVSDEDGDGPRGAAPDSPQAEDGEDDDDAAARAAERAGDHAEEPEDRPRRPMRQEEVSGLPETPGRGTGRPQRGPAGPTGPTRTCKFAATRDRSASMRGCTRSSAPGQPSG